jgi:hypothetical protein
MRDDGPDAAKIHVKCSDVGPDGDRSAGPRLEGPSSARVASVATERLIEIDRELIEREAAMVELRSEVERLTQMAERWCDVVRSEGLDTGDRLPSRFQLELKEVHGDRESEQFQQQARQWARLFNEMADSSPPSEGVPEGLRPLLALAPNFRWDWPGAERTPRASGADVVGWVTSVLEENGGGPMRLVDITNSLRQGQEGTDPAKQHWRVPGGGKPANVAVHLKRATDTFEKVDGRGWQLKRGATGHA